MSKALQLLKSVRIRILSVQVWLTKDGFDATLMDFDPEPGKSQKHQVTKMGRKEFVEWLEKFI